MTRHRRNSRLAVVLVFSGVFLAAAPVAAARRVVRAAGLAQGLFMERYAPERKNWVPVRDAAGRRVKNPDGIVFERAKNAIRVGDLESTLGDDWSMSIPHRLSRNRARSGLRADRMLRRPSFGAPADPARAQ